MSSKHEPTIPESMRLPDDRIGIYYRVIFHARHRRMLVEAALPSLLAAQQRMADACALYILTYAQEHGAELTVPDPAQPTTLRLSYPAEILDDGMRTLIHLPDRTVEFSIEEDVGEFVEDKDEVDEGGAGDAGGGPTGPHPD
jgi:hypothetical protein